LKYAEIQEKYDATVLTIGSQRGTLLGCDGEDADGVFSGIDFQRKMETTGQRYNFKGKKVIVVGGGNTAMDCCRSALRCGSTDVKVVYRRTEKEMPANPIEIHESKLEGVEYLFLHNPVVVNKDDEGKLKSVKLIKMGLGEPDASGRRRPIPLEGSEFDLEADYILAAIGQKTDINFLDDVNSVVKQGELKANKWGDLDADPKTLQTGVPSIFAAGDGVTGPATLIEAIAQANKAWVSCHQYLMGEKIEPRHKEFVSRRDNFKKQDPNDYIGRYQRQLRNEMPVLDPKDRVNYKEVELGYENENVAQTEAARCFECGCSEFFDCKLQQYADKYEADQKYYGGEFKSYSVDFSHPLIEIDNNKCILCSKCIRVCDEVVGAKALGLVQRGFETFVGPAMNKKLTDTDCESCGMCVSICPTGAMIENVPFKIMPVKADKIETIDCFTSEGAAIELHQKGGFIFRAEGFPGLVNKKGSIGKHAKFGYRIFNDGNRITKPMLKENGKWKEISFDEAFAIIKKNIAGSEKDTMTFASGRYSNEELYLLQKFVRTALGTDNIHSLAYIGRGRGYTYAGNENLQMDDLKKASKIYILGSDINYSNSLVNHMIFNAAYRAKSEIILITDKEHAKVAYKCDKVVSTSSYYNFFKALNKIVVTDNLVNKFFIDGNVSGFDNFKSQIEKTDLATLSASCGISAEELKKFVTEFNNEQNAVIVFTEKEVSSAVAREIMNLSLLTGKTVKTGSGILCVKEKNNSQGLIDMGIRPELRPGAKSIDSACLMEDVKSGNYKNFIIFGEDPIGQAINPAETAKWFANKRFMAVQDYFMTKTAEEADLVLPASFNFETGGSYTNSQKMLLQFDKALSPKCGKDNLEQLSGLFNAFGIEQSSCSAVVFEEIMEIFAKTDVYKQELVFTEKDYVGSYFKNTCDVVFEKLEEIFKQ
ncbi:MAG: molybdopterin-dependent oxidoreductase, partial [Bacteroidales bacterium]|nr:molybdopterin-dependent oxidoreductase [Bacteroidales bacterium]